MRIALEARALAQKKGGIRTYVTELVRHLSLQDPQHEVHILPDLKHPALFLKWLWRDIPAALKKIQPDLVHFTKVDMPLTKHYPTIVTIYDVIPILFPQSQKPLQRFYWPRVLHRSAQLSDHIITISEASKRDIVRLLNVPTDKVTVTPLAIDHTRFTLASTEAKAGLRTTYQLNNPYILFVSTIEPRKNVPALIRAFARIAGQIPQSLVIAGRIYRGKNEIDEAVQQANLSDRIRLLNFVDNQDLPALYSGADLFVMPSLYEGWGLPALEAMACGAPVIVSNGGSLPEVVGQAGEIVKFSTDNLHDRMQDDVFEKKLSERMQAILTDTQLNQKMREAGLEHVQKFSWQDVAYKTMEVYKKVA